MIVNNNNHHNNHINNIKNKHNAELQQKPSITLHFPIVIQKRDCLSLDRDEKERERKAEKERESKRTGT